MPIGTQNSHNFWMLNASHGHMDTIVFEGASEAVWGNHMLIWVTEEEDMLYILGGKDLTIEEAQHIAHTFASTH